MLGVTDFMQRALKIYGLLAIIMGVQATQVTFSCPSKNHLTRVFGAETIANGRTVLGAVQVACSNSNASPVYGGKWHEQCLVVKTYFYQLLV